MSKKRIKVISFFLAIFMILGFIPTSVIAMESNKEDASKWNSDEFPIMQPEKDPSLDYGMEEKITEIVDRREENVKHFRMADGSVRAISYGCAVHRKDENGIWQDIDNRLYSANDGTYSTVENRISFAKDATGDNFLTLKENGYIISMGYITQEVYGLRAETIKVTNHPSREEQLASISTDANQDEKMEKMMMVDNKTRVIYQNVQNGISLEYILQSNDVKENIIISAPQDDYVYKFTLQLEGLNAELLKDGSIILSDVSSGAEVYMIPCPYMVDANGKKSTDVFYELELLKDNIYILTVKADSNWFNQTSRAFPVMIDPFIRQRAHTDTYITATNPTLAPYSESTLWVGTNKITYIRPALNSIPQGSQVSFATLNVSYYFHSNVTEGTLNVGVYQVKESWSSSLTWNYANNNMNNFGLSTTSVSTRTLRGDLGAYASSPQKQSFVITSVVNSWFNGSSNNGVALKRESGTLYDVILYSVNSGATYCPYFIIDYLEPKLVEGVYRLKNAYNYLYLTTAGTYYLSGAPIRQNASKGTNDLTQLFKITYIRDYGHDRYYDIRPMTNSALGLDAPITGTDRSVKANTMATTDGWFDIPQTQRWTFQTTGTSSSGLRKVKIQNAFSDNGGYLTAPSSFDDGESIFADTTANDWNSEWYLEPYTGQTLEGVRLLSTSTSVNCGKSFDYDAYMYSSKVGVNGPITYLVANEDYTSTDKATIDSATGMLTAIKPGKIRVRFTFPGTTTYWSIIVTLNIPFENGIIHTLKNSTDNKLMKPQTADLNSKIILNSYSNAQTSMMWKFEYVSNGYYKIINDVTGYYLRAPASNTLGAAITQSSYSSNYALWRFERTVDVYYTIQSKNQYENSTSTPLFLSISGTNVIQSDSANAAKWVISPLILKINVVYDQGFIDRYGSTYMEVLNMIYGNNSNNISFASVFKERFGIKVKVNISQAVHSSYPYEQECIYKHDIDTYCYDCKNEMNESAVTECSSGKHHKAELSMLGQLPYQSLENANNTTILYTGHRGCCTDGNTHTTQYAYGWSSTNCNRIVILSALFEQNIKNSDINGVLRTTVHEHMHSLGAPHCDQTEDCIMSKNTPTINANLTMCSTCQNIVNNNKFKLYKMST